MTYEPPGSSAPQGDQPQQPPQPPVPPARYVPPAGYPQDPYQQAPHPQVPYQQAPYPQAPYTPGQPPHAGPSTPYGPPAPYGQVPYGVAPQAYDAQGHPLASYPGYAGQRPAPAAGPGGIAIAAIIVAVLAFLSGWLPVVGALLGAVGLVLSILAVRTPAGRVLGIIGIILSSLALLTGLFMTIGFFSYVPWLD